ARMSEAISGIFSFVMVPACRMRSCGLLAAAALFRRLGRKPEGKNGFAVGVRHFHLPAVARAKRAIQLAQLFAAGGRGFLPGGGMVGKLQPLILEGTRLPRQRRAEIEEIERHALHDSRGARDLSVRSPTMQPERLKGRGVFPEVSNIGHAIGARLEQGGPYHRPALGSFR